MAARERKRATKPHKTPLLPREADGSPYGWNREQRETIIAETLEKHSDCVPFFDFDLSFPRYFTTVMDKPQVREAVTSLVGQLDKFCP
jgi:hypothetical protein